MTAEARKQRLHGACPSAAPRIHPRMVRPPAPAPLAPLELGALRAGLGLTPQDLEAVLTAVADRAELAPADERARLARGRLALELELGRAIA